MSKNNYSLQSISAQKKVSFPDLIDRNSAWVSLWDPAPLTRGVIIHIKLIQHENLKLNWAHRDRKISGLKKWMILSQKIPRDHVLGKHTKTWGSYPFISLTILFFLWFYGLINLFCWSLAEFIFCLFFFTVFFFFFTKRYSHKLISI